MAVKFEKLVKDTANTMKKAGKKKTSEYDTNGVVKRVDGKTAWVHFDGGVDETPVRMTISAKAGDKVRVHVGGGKAYITGNETAPPTDDREAKKASAYAGEAYKASQDAQTSADNAQKTANDAITATDALEDDLEILAGDVEDISDLVGDGDDSGIEVKTQYYLSTSNSSLVGGEWVDSLPTYVSGRYYWTRTVTIYADGSQVEGTPKLDITAQIGAEVNSVVTAENQHFWHDSTGAYITNSNKNLNSGYAMKATTNGLLQTYDGKNLMALTGSGLSLYGIVNNASQIMAAYTSSGANLYAGGSIAASFTSSGLDVYSGSDIYATFGSTARIGKSTGLNTKFSSGGMALCSGSTQVGSLSYTYGQFQISFAPTNFQSDTYIVGSSSSLEVHSDGQLSMSSDSIMQIQSDGNMTLSSYGDITIAASVGNVYTNDLETDVLNVTSSATINKLYVTTPGTATSDKANCRIATGENNRIMFTGSSSREIKHAIKPVTDNFLDPHKLYNAEVVQFIYNMDYLNKNDARYDMPVVGFIAEDLYKVYPVAVDLEHSKPHDWNERYIIPPMLALIQEHKKEIDLLTERVKILEERSVA